MENDERRIALAKWILESDVAILNEVEIIYKKQSKKELKEIVGYTIDGKALTKENYIKHINNVRNNVKNGARTYTTNEVRDYVLSNKSY